MNRSSKWLVFFLEVTLCFGEEYLFSKVSCGLIINLCWDAFCCPGCWFMSRIFEFEVLTIDKDRTSTSTFYCLCSMCWELMHKAISSGIICCFKIISTGTRKSDAKFSEWLFCLRQFCSFEESTNLRGKKSNKCQVFNTGGHCPWVTKHLVQGVRFESMQTATP